MKIIGIDPGYGILGYGVLEKSGNKISHITHGVITTDKELSMYKRLQVIYEEFLRLLKEYSPDACAIESLFFYKNVKTAIRVGEARGVILLATSQMDLPLYEFTPYQVKNNITGYGHSDKKQVQKMVKMLLNLDKIPRPDDAADALAVAWCLAVETRF
ncbi:Holliday junction resolvase [Thermosipho melanesiensis]|uniref:Crossover junction endodeoxyribonuclease RuvC n=2 Tax=Thermosipho melanesiensis TaxID=46541 RepID=RUVC_THEM4|nr:crossover junction endodeoxyribonuclease RuvC [Thermosipho melanesiensis]A6LLU8.1 RecName: Full=Crossover junction endodeoxyribonuclease RuvC; AltName: Full=Holliday junction nuclease RuvC; AltName: Full=Holliday junction resolvase RuvC [Thermosipho melanesiensis BI429]ABR30899.1 crossover junction endodeoxyribonuclease RuvC [Thermosipho melanesiensis BI429]APT74018.1 Holliday junction resolvase [Thermosipho melanesiensis]OOC35946.1 Holliday junction resolvase [Thermosipho melanesiensis]OOC